MLLGDLTYLVAETVRVWWRLLPQLVALYLFGWVGSELTLRVAVIAGDLSPWLTLVLFAFNFVWVLVASILMLSLVDEQLGIRALIPADESEPEHRDTSLTRLIAVTLLPFLGMYAAFGQVADAANTLLTQQFVRYGVGGDTVIGTLNRLSTDHPLRLLGLLIVLYVGRRLLDAVHERTGRRILGLGVVLIESFFLLVLILGGIRVFQQAVIWLRGRVFMQWLADLRDRLAEFLAALRIDLPALLVAAERVWSEVIWPLAVDVLAEPLLWLAVAALVFGSRVLSLAELWRKGQPYAERLRAQTPFASRRERRRTAAPAPNGVRFAAGPNAVRFAAGQLREAFFGDIDDKYLPTAHALRLVLRAGVVFLGSYVVLYTLLRVGRDQLERGIDALLGGHEVAFWVTWGPLIDVVPGVVFEPLRLCLLAVAFHRCLQAFRRRSPDSGLMAEQDDDAGVPA